MPFPNPDTQFKPGESGNPAGKPKGSLHLSTHIQNMLNDEEFTTWLTDTREGFKEYKGAPLKAIIKTAMIQAMSNSKEGAAAREWLAKYGYGQKFELEHTGDVMTKQLSQEELDARIAEYIKRKSTP